MGYEDRSLPGVDCRYATAPITVAPDVDAIAARIEALGAAR